MEHVIKLLLLASVTQVGSVHGVECRTVLETPTVTDAVFAYHQQRKEISPSATVLKVGWEKLVSCLVSTVNRLLTTNAFVILVMVEMAANCFARTTVTFVSMVHVIVDLMAGGEMRAKEEVVLDMARTALVMESVSLLHKPVSVMRDGKVN